MKRVIKRYMLSHEENNHQPYLLRERGVVALVAIIFIFFAFAHIQSYIVRTHAPAAVIRSVVVDLTNADRTTRGLRPLTINPVLVQAAELKARDMATKGYFSHVSPDNLTPWHWLSQVQYAFLYAGENLAVNFSESEDVERAWMESTGHRNNILNTKFTEIGVATAEGTFNGKPAIFVVQMFGFPRSGLGTSSPRSSLGTSSLQSGLGTAKLAPTLFRGKVATTTVPEVTTVKDMFIAVQDASASQPLAANASTSVPAYSNALSRLFLQPKHILAAAYGIIAILILSACGFIFVGELKRYHTKMVIYGVALIALMVVLAYSFSLFNTSTIIIA